MVLMSLQERHHSQVDTFTFRHTEASDYQSIISVINSWWGGRTMTDMLPKLFFVHFRQTSFIAEKNGKIAGFLTGFVSQTFSNEAYIHFVGVHPEYRHYGLGRALYERFFHAVQNLGCTRVSSVTSPVNKNSIAFHLHMGFSMEPGDTKVDGISVIKDYDGFGEDRVFFCKSIKQGSSL